MGHRGELIEEAGLGPVDWFGTSRDSRLFPELRLAHADLHNHSLLSDGAGDPERAFESMRSAGLDVAALTDHASVGIGPARPHAAGMDEDKWNRVAAIADAEHAEGRFVAIRGFEWTTPANGHVNVWFSGDWVNPLDTNGVGPAARMDGFYRWLAERQEALAGFNHPGREPGRFSEFAFDPGALAQVVGLELFNRGDDYLFEGVEVGRRSAVAACLDAGWRPGVTGVSDEHGNDWGDHPEKGRTGLYLDTLTRASVSAALEARRSFATVVPGLRLDAAANGTRMGGVLGHRRGPVRVDVDLDAGERWYGRQVGVQLVRPGAGTQPSVAYADEVKVPAPDEPLISFTVDLDLDDGPWALLRVTDPDEPADRRAQGDLARAGGAVAYASPFYLDPT